MDEVNQKTYKTVNINGKLMIVLLDTGSDLYLIEAKEYFFFL
jgi:hypothetical protein